MAFIGEQAELTVLRETDPGYYLDSEEELGDVLLPYGECLEDLEVGDRVLVFIYTDSADRPVATMNMPYVLPGEFASLECVADTKIGAFMDWGLEKDLLVPFREQTSRMEEGKKYVVFAYRDKVSDRIVASRRINKHLSDETPDYEEGQEVDLLVYAKTDMGYKAIINGKHSGLLFANDVFRKLAPGEETKGYVVKVRENEKIDISLQEPGRGRIATLESRIEEELTARGGSWSLCDSSSPEEISAALGVSKKAFKQATGSLFKQRKITITKNGIRFVDSK